MKRIYAEPLSRYNLTPLGERVGEEISADEESGQSLFHWYAVQHSSFHVLVIDRYGIYLHSNKVVATVSSLVS